MSPYHSASKRKEAAMPLAKDAQSRLAFPSTTVQDVPEPEVEISPTRMLLGFLDRHMRRFSPAIQNTIGLVVALLLFIVTLHATVAPTFVSGHLFAKISENDEKEPAASYMVEYDGATSFVTDLGNWMIPIRGGMPRRIRLQVYKLVGKQLVDEVSLVGPWPIVNALYPMEYQLTVHTYKQQGRRIEVTRRTSVADMAAALLDRIGLSRVAYAQAPGPQLHMVVHLQNLGTVGCASPNWCGTKGESRRLEAFSIRLSPPVPGLTAKYFCHVQDIGDTGWLDEGQFCGTQGQGKRIEGFAIRLEGAQANSYDILYQAHIENRGDTPINRNGVFVGTRGQSLRVEAMKAWIAPRR
jgi:hypothetical protein